MLEFIFVISQIANLQYGWLNSLDGWWEIFYWTLLLSFKEKRRHVSPNFYQNLSLCLPFSSSPSYCHQELSLPCSTHLGFQLQGTCWHAPTTILTTVIINYRWQLVCPLHRLSLLSLRCIWVALHLFFLNLHCQS